MALIQWLGYNNQKEHGKPRGNFTWLPHSHRNPYLQKDKPSPRSLYILKHDTGIQILLQNTHDYFSSCNSDFSMYRDVGTGAQGPTWPVFSQSNYIMKGCSETSLSEAFARTAISNAEDSQLHNILSCWKDQKVKRAEAGMEVIRLSWPLSYLLKTWYYLRHCTFTLWYHTDPRKVHFSQKREQYRPWTHCLLCLSYCRKEEQSILSLT